MTGLTPSVDPYEAVLREAFGSLHPHVRAAHRAPLTATGTFDVEHGRHWSAPVIIWLMALPVAGRALAVRLDVRAARRGVQWIRQIGSSTLLTCQTVADGRLVERSGIGRLAFDLSVVGGALHYRQHAMSVAGVRLPGFMSPRVSASVSPDADGWRVSVSVTWRARLVCRYAGRMRER